APTVETALELTTFLEDRDDAPRTSRFTGSLTERLFPANRWSAGLVLGYDRNDELDLAGRARLVGFGTRTLTQSNQAELRASAGLVLIREEYFSTDSTTGGVEGLLATAFRAFRYDHPKLDGYVSVQAFPSLSIQGRVRLQADLRLSYELVEDFMLTGTVFDSYDSKPQAAGAEKNDFGTTLAITWTF
ncbi:MAG: hypothetical protein K0S19_1572, partial [Geminicoccaceae bacterium]|nr:hypothetical protein [Geminicoccaceae bacterium]